MTRANKFGFHALVGCVALAFATSAFAVDTSSDDQQLWQIEMSWKAARTAENFDVVATRLVTYRARQEKTFLEVDYMLATCWCRGTDLLRRKNGRSVLLSLSTHAQYEMTSSQSDVIAQELSKCRITQSGGASQSAADWPVLIGLPPSAPPPPKGCFCEMGQRGDQGNQGVPAAIFAILALLFRRKFRRRYTSGAVHRSA